MTTGLFASRTHPGSLIVGTDIGLFRVNADDGGFTMITLLRSDDGGASFHPANPAVTGAYHPINAIRELDELDVTYAVGISPANPDQVVMAGVAGVIASSNGGASWQAIANPSDFQGPDEQRLYVHVDAGAI